MSTDAGELTIEQPIEQPIDIPYLNVEAALALATFALIALFVFLGLYQLRPPAAVPASAPPTEFSSARAMRHLDAIAQQPHPMGVPAHAQVRDYLVQQLRDLGLNPTIQQATSVNTGTGVIVQAGSVENIVARIPGTASGKAIMLAAHYDSVLSGPGASDNAAGVAAILEAARALKARPPLRNDVVLLLTDGEESGLLGALAFAHEHPLAKEVALVVNLDARGNSGPVVMFQTSTGNSRLIQEFAQAVPYPQASSLFYDVYQLLPNDTDLTVFQRAGMAGFNMAFIDGFLHYHAAIDSIANVDERSVQHHGTYILALAQRFGDLDLTNLSAADSIYFNAFGRLFVHYPNGWAIPLALLVALLFIAVAVLGFRRGQLTFLGVVLGLLAFLLNLALVTVAITLLVQIINALHPGYFSILHGEPYNSYLYLIAFVAPAVAITSALYVLVRKKLSAENLAFGALLVWLLLTLATSVVFQGGSYLFTWPLLFGLAGMAVLFRSPQPKPGFGRRMIAVLCAIPAIMLLSPLIYLAFITLTMRVSAPVMVAVVLLLGLLIPHLSFLTAQRRWLLSTLAGAVCLIFLVAGSVESSFTASRPRTDDVMYALDSDSGTAVWASGAPNPDEWTSQFLSENIQHARLDSFLPSSPWELTQSPAPAVALAGPQATLLDDTTAGAVRTLRLRITSTRHAPLVFIYADPHTEVLGALVNGKPADIAGPVASDARISWGMFYWGLPADGIELTLKVKPSQPVTLRVVDRTDGLPEIPGRTFRPRPDYIIPAPSIGPVAQFSNSTMVLKTVTF